MTLYTKNPRMPPKTVRINKFIQVAGYKLNIQKTVAFLYINNELPERQIKKTISSTNTLKRIKYLGISLTKEVKDLH